MSRLPFDPARMAGPPANPKESGPTAGATPPIRVGQLALLIEGAVRSLPTPVRVIGEVSNLTQRGHWYFAIKDAEAVVSCVMFANRARSLGFVPVDGQEVVVAGRVEFYKPQGRVSFYVEAMEPVGLGALQLAYRKLVEEVRALGWMAPERKRPLPAFPRRVAVVTSRTGAALQDVLATMRKRCPAVEVVFVDVKVQGDEAAAAVAGALRWLSQEHDRLGVDAVVVTRGGGSIEDLWAFNEKTVAQAIVGCAVPVVAAIGHETDVTIAELVADERCATPTQAAMRLTPDRQSLEEQLALLAGRLSQTVRREAHHAGERLRAVAGRLASTGLARAQHAARSLEQAATRLERQRPAAIYAARSARLERLTGALVETFTHRLADADVRPLADALTRSGTALARQRVDAMEGLERQLGLVGPQAVLARGYSVTFDDQGRVVRRPTDARPGQGITTRLSEGTLESIVRGSANDPLAPASPLPLPRRRRKQAADEGPGLFV